jgi:hypothetical protein
VSLIYLEESRRFASPCSFKQKFVCGSLWQAALDSVGIVSYYYYQPTAKGYALSLNLPDLSAAISNTDCGAYWPALVSGPTTPEADIVQTMALDAFRSETVDGEISRI